MKKLMKKGDEFWYVDFIPSWIGNYTLKRYIYQGTVHNSRMEIKDWHIAMDWSFSSGDLRLFKKEDFERPLSFFTSEKEATEAIKKRFEQELEKLKI
jgi:hypothetical protein